ncbi:MAG: LysE family translocator [Cyanobacteria bacterium P01_F01_bin.3]
MTISSFVALFVAMVSLAALPSISVLTVVTRSLSGGFFHGAIATAGIATGDGIFILLAVYGLSLMADVLGPFFLAIKWVGGAYLIWLGIGLWRAKAGPLSVKTVGKTSWTASFLNGLLITLGDQKAVFFYVVFLPAFVDLDQLSVMDTGMILMCAIAALGSVKLTYAYMADRMSLLLRNARVQKIINTAASVVMLATGLDLIFAAAFSR